ncbi:MAG TPA: imidazole glycerol phosphate synthase subunit HisH [Aestuariivirgaceae bacterium]|nr:imidazole glycerol phosphate synthase subunit HisH [Aestuariivirgaceae bacterium]
MRAAIVDYGSGNLRSAEKAFERAAYERGIRAEILVTHDPEEVRRADRIILPGVGAFKDCRDGLHAIVGLTEALEEKVIEKGNPFLGICVGMQLMATSGMEFGETPGLGWIEGIVRPIQPHDVALKVPHMGWNAITPLRDHPLLAGITYGENAPHAYFVHSFGFAPDNPSDILATTDYGGAMVAAVARGNMAGTQFHPEKSQALGINLLANFLEWRP